MPQAAQTEIRERFCRDDDTDHLAAFWEMYLHECFVRLGFEVDVAIGLDSTDRRPDFKLRRGDGELLVEATAVRGSRVASPAAARQAAERAAFIPTPFQALQSLKRSWESRKRVPTRCFVEGERRDSNPRPPGPQVVRLEPRSPPGALAVTSAV